MALLHVGDGHILNGRVRSQAERFLPLQIMAETLTMQSAGILRTEEPCTPPMPEGPL